MTNAQIKFWDKKPMQKVLIVADILRVASGQFNTSHELKLMMDPVIITLITTALNGYGSSGFTEPASHIGSLCAELAQRGLLVHGKKDCTVLHRNEDAFMV